MARKLAGDLEMATRQRVGKELRAQRVRLRLTQKRLANALGMSDLSIICYEAGRTPLRIELLPALRSVGFDVSALVLVALGDDPVELGNRPDAATASTTSGETRDPKDQWPGVADGVEQQEKAKIPRVQTTAVNPEARNKELSEFNLQAIQNCDAIFAVRPERHRTKQEVRNIFELHGAPISAWAAFHGFPSATVYSLLRTGEEKLAHRGMSHVLAVVFGLKDGYVVEDDEDRRRELLPLLGPERLKSRSEAFNIAPSGDS